MAKQKKIRVALSGASGRMGQLIAQLIREDENFSPKFLLSDVADADLGIDFSAPEATLNFAQIAAKSKIPVLIGTTGFSKAHLSELRKVLGKNAWALVPNTSLGIYALGEALRKALAVLPKSYSASMIEIHHAAKKDAPSGTAKQLAGIISEAWQGGTDLPIFSLRAGTDPGEHKIIVLGPSERLEFTHRAESRELFARGALHLAIKLSKQKARSAPYSIAELL